MRAVTLEPFLAELVYSLGAGEHLRGVGHGTAAPEEASKLPVVTSQSPQGGGPQLARHALDRTALAALEPDLVIAAPPGFAAVDPGRRTEHAAELERELRAFLGSDSVRLHCVVPRTFEEVVSAIEELGKVMGRAAAGRSSAQKLKAQCMDWADNFYERMKNKRVTFLSSVAPFRLAGRWVPDLIKLCSAQSQEQPGRAIDAEIVWEDVIRYNPDVIIVAPEGATLDTALQSFHRLQELPKWEDVPAVKRGEVVFTGGSKHFYEPGMRLIESMAILISAIAGLESGYITERDSFHRLRWLELHRHRI